MNEVENNEVERVVVREGGDINDLRWFHDHGPALLPYVTLTSARGVAPELASITAVYEWQGRPLVFLVAASLDEDSLRRLRRRLALFGEAPYLGIVEAGRLTVHRVALDHDARADLPAQEGPRIPWLAHYRPGTGGDAVADVVLSLLSQAIGDLAAGGVSESDAVSLAGRALFTRFLADRHLLPEEIAPTLASATSLFDDRSSAHRTSQWLDRTFNGDLLPVRDVSLATMSPELLRPLSRILSRAPGNQLWLAWKADWPWLDFAHIPVGVLSQAYEHHVATYRKTQQRREGGFYTPRPIAETLIGAAFAALRAKGCAHSARVLDPAAGAGVFLLIAFRHLVAEHWRAEGVRPDTAVLRRILLEQLKGFDVNESGLRFAALGLYLAAIELDPNPLPVEKLSFPKLGDTVLIHVGEPDGERGLGSLGDRVGPEHIGQYDIVTGNPPWTSGTGLPDWKSVKARVNLIASSRGVDSAILPNEALDLPFLWRALEWARPEGQIALAMHARVWFQQGDGMPKARLGILKALDITAIVNGAAIRQKRKVWPGVSAPFCLVFARNQPPTSSSAFRFVSLPVDDAINDAGLWRLDARAAPWLCLKEVEDDPFVLKTMFRGSPLDREALYWLRGRGFDTLDSWWRTHIGERRRRLLDAGNGYQRLRKSSRILKGGDGKKGSSAAYLHELPHLEETFDGLRVPKDLRLFDLDRIHDPRARGIFSAPLLLLRQSPSFERRRLKVAVSEVDVVYNESWYGYSARRHPNGSAVVRYLALVLSSRVALWHGLLTSGKFGFERDVLEKSTIEHTPIPDFDGLDIETRAEAETLFELVANNPSETNWGKVDAWVAQLYGLQDRDREVIDDTLTCQLPHPDAVRHCQRPPKPTEITAFETTLRESLVSWTGTGLQVTQLPSGGSPWRSLGLSLGSVGSPPVDWYGLVRAADATAASELLHPDVQRRVLWVGRLDQLRYWTRSAARLLARQIIWTHLDVFLGRESA